MVFDQLEQQIRLYETITIFGHVRPDGDCFGSQIGLRELLKTSFPEKKIFAIGTGWPSFSELIGNMDKVDDLIISKSLALVLDVANEERIEDQRYKTASLIIKIDHHISDKTFGKFQFIDTAKSSTCEIISEFMIQKKLLINKQGATALALGIITDTGRFLFGNNTSQTFLLFSKLIDSGANLESIYQKLNISKPNELGFKAYVYNHFHISPRGVLSCIIPYSTSLRLGIEPWLAASKVNMLSNVEGCPIWVLMGKDKSFIHVEIRSSGVNIQPIAVSFGGGGHSQAAGCHVKTLSEAKKLIKVLDNLINNGEKKDVSKTIK